MQGVLSLRTRLLRPLRTFNAFEYERNTPVVIRVMRAYVLSMHTHVFTAVVSLILLAACRIGGVEFCSLHQFAVDLDLVSDE